MPDKKKKKAAAAASVPKPRGTAVSVCFGGSRWQWFTPPGRRVFKSTMDRGTLSKIVKLAENGDFGHPVFTANVRKKGFFRRLYKK